MRLQQKALHSQLRAESIATRERLASLLRPVDPSKINEHPEPGRWSVGEVLEPRCVADEAVQTPYATLMRGALPDAGAPSREWKSSFIGGLIAGALLKPKPLKSPKVFLPGSAPRGGVVEDFLSREMKFVNAMDGAAAFDWRALRLGSPALPGWMPKMNLGDAFRIHVVHVTRHAGQIERLVARL